MATDNPAQRLHDILEAGLKYRGEQSCREVWQSILKTEDRPLLMTRLGKVMALPAQVEASIREHFPEHVRHQEHWLAAVYSAFAQQNLDGQWLTFRNHVKGPTLGAIAMAAAALQGRGTFEALNDEQIKALSEKLAALRDSLFDLNLPEDLHRYLAKQISKMMDALEEYRLTGSSRVVELVEETLGHVGGRPAYRAEHDRSPGFQTFLDGLNAIANTVTIAPQVPLLAHTVAVLLTS